MKVSEIQEEENRKIFTKREEIQYLINLVKRCLPFLKSFQSAEAAIPLGLSEEECQKLQALIQEIER